MFSAILLPSHQLAVIRVELIELMESKYRASCDNSNIQQADLLKMDNAGVIDAMWQMKRLSVEGQKKIKHIFCLKFLNK
ncbi:hypothetical protein EF878_16710 [Dickeya undicola]|uniref:Uncharacterized protein n=1 Tax=Dickeya undicola TaxID=1577887 RepID=A0A3N0FWD9_9GAMM|nr:hypothetical protein EF878_16710 [Dickeya undicola]